MSSTRGMNFGDEKNVSGMLGLTMVSVTSNDEEVVFESNDGRRFKLYHSQDCCESVTVDDIDGDLDLLVGQPLIQAEEVESEPPKVERQYEPESETWTFYKFATIKGHVTIRFYGTSNGYYSESVYFTEM